MREKLKPSWAGGGTLGDIFGIFFEGDSALSNI
jgi:hypothetical protein